MNTRENKYKVLVYILILSVTVQVFAPIGMVFAANKKGVCTANKLMIRTGPATSYSAVVVNGTEAYLVKNQVVEILDSSSSWYKISAEFKGKKVEGYSLGSYISIAESTVQDNEENNAKGICTANKLMVRKGPSTEYDKVISENQEVYLTKGQSVEILEKNESWYKIRADFNGKTIEGYSSGQYIKLVDNSNPTAALTPTKAVTPTPKPTSALSQGMELSLSASVTANELNVRKDAKTSSSKLATLKKGDKVTVIGEKSDGKNNWYKINVKVDGKNITGYAVADYIKLSTTRGFYAELLKDIKPVLRAGSNSTVTLPDGSALSISKGTVWISDEVTASGSKWFRIGKSIDGKAYKGYIKAENVKLLGRKTATPTPTPTSKPAAPTNKPETIVKDNLEIKGKVLASTLNLRSEASTSSQKLAVLKNGDAVTILEEVDIKGDTWSWYKVKTVVSKKEYTGYVYSRYIALVDTEKGINAAVDANNTKIRKSASSSAAYLKNKEGNIIYLSEGTRVTIKEEVTGNAYKWYLVNFNYEGSKYSGYIQSNEVDLCASPTPSPVPTATLTPVPTATLTPVPTTGIVSATPVPTEIPASIVPTPTEPVASLTPTPLPTPTPITGKGKIESDSMLVVRTQAGYSGSILTDDSNNAVLLNNGIEVEVVEGVVIDGVTWCNIIFAKGSILYNGYITDRYIVFYDKDNNDNSATITPEGNPDLDMSFEALLEEQGFPESYRIYLRKLHKAYPNWRFTAFQTGLVWEDVINNESVAGKNLIPNSKSIEWKSLDNGAYNWKTDSFIVYDGSTWVTASKEAIEYYMDPRNFLDEKGIFQFETLAFESSYQNYEGVENILRYTPMYDTVYTYDDEAGNPQNITYAQTFMEAAVYSGVSPYHLASRVKQEVVTGTTTFSNSVTGTVQGWEGLYNFYNIGAYNSTAPGGAIANGLKYAKNGSSSVSLNTNALIPWRNRYRAILGGAYIIGYSYISRGQNTIYLEKFNVTNTSTYSHQYMANVEAAYSEGKKVYTAYSMMENVPLVFSIPVYLNMPEQVSPVPEVKYNPNNWLRSLEITDMSGNTLALTPTFDITKEQEYSIFVDASCDMINVNASAVSKKATVSGNGYYTLTEGNNVIIVYVVAENGDIRQYTITIVK